MTSPRRRKAAITLSSTNAAGLAALLTTIDEFLRSDCAAGTLAAFLASRGAQFPDPPPSSQPGRRAAGRSP